MSRKPVVYNHRVNAQNRLRGLAAMTARAAESSDQLLKVEDVLRKLNFTALLVATTGGSDAVELRYELGSELYYVNYYGLSNFLSTYQVDEAVQTYNSWVTMRAEIQQGISGTKADMIIFDDPASNLTLGKPKP